jgi:OPA family sugar phosphate sensor protein UhpC-like MFS transporter
LPFKTPPDAAPISDKRELDERYRYWRRHILLTIWLGYAVLFHRKSFNAAVPEIRQQRADPQRYRPAGDAVYITYGLSKFSPVSSATAPTPAILWAWADRHRAW